jgi:predicted ATPase
MHPKQIHYVEIEKFKSFDGKIRIELGHPAVLIGPNNAGKTSVIQALALWSRGIRAWYDKKGQPQQKTKRERLSAGINRLNLFELPVTDTRQLWKDTRVTKNNKSIPFNITVGINVKGEIKACKLSFTRRDSETIYCRPDASIVEDDQLLEHASKLNFNLLYPMSGIDAQEILLQEGRINVLMGQGQTAQVLRNLAYMITEKSETDWTKIQTFIKQLFMIELNSPVFNDLSGTLELSYREAGIDKDLDISMSGRGLQQMLLILVYLFSHKRSILLVDEPDAHLEILRQKQVYSILKELAEELGCQVVIATHSEVILDDAVETNLTLLIDDSSVDLATQNDMKTALRSIGVEHYYKAKVHPRILYVEGNTDIEMLKALAKKLEHEAFDVLSGKLNCHYTQDISPDSNLDSQLSRPSKLAGNYKKHFHTLRRYVGEFKGIAIFDSDGNPKADSTEEGLTICHWQSYELENYFITPEVLKLYVEDIFEEDGQELFSKSNLSNFIDSLNETLLSEVFGGDKSQLQEFEASSKALQRTLLKNTKMSSFTTKVFKCFAAKQKQPVLINKGEFYQFVQFIDIDDIPAEVTEKLDHIVATLKL